MGARSAAVMHMRKEDKGITGNKHNTRYNKPQKQ